MPNEYQIELSGRISLKGTFDGNTKEDAVHEAERELRRGDISEIEVETCIYLDPNPDA